ncbi:DUF305 domain-containing protein [Hymenobacter lapidiphilus]|nr:DUF305 domain-containing protein [Hymenobacter sp. CCM 8763]
MTLPSSWSTTTKRPPPSDHHQAAIDNSEALLQCGRNATTRALAQSIITDQRQKIAALQNWLTRNR